MPNCTSEKNKNNLLMSYKVNQENVLNSFKKNFFFFNDDLKTRTHDSFVRINAFVKYFSTLQKSTQAGYCSKDSHMHLHNNKNIYKAPTLVRRDYFKRIHTHKHIIHTETRTHEHAEHTKLNLYTN